MEKKPKHFLVLKLIGFLGLALSVVGFILVITGFGEFENNNFIIGGFLSCFGLFIGVSCLIYGFSPELSKMRVQSARYIQSQNKDELSDMVSTAADISSDAITTVAKAVKEGLEDTMYCKHCGAKIDADSKFCNKCGKDQ